ncbi:MAG: ABC transporter ATP-binding protein [Patescibacteria group bacterium]|nr:ABC transporter ATP-binding protein [Patescibacteria group bacterium]
MNDEILLKLEEGTVEYGGVRALSGVTLSVDEGEIIALMGPNGAGKTTALKALFGIAPLSEGRVLFHGEEIQPVAAEMVRRGIAYVPQGRQVFKSLSVLENLELGGYALSNRSDVATNIESALEFFPMLREKLSLRAGSLSGGQQQMLTIARGLVADPRILLLDEPSLGLSPKIVKEVFALVKEINRARGIAVVVVEHSIRSVLDIADRAYVLSRGEIILDEPAAKLLEGDTLEKVFLSAVNKN